MCRGLDRPHGDGIARDPECESQIALLDVRNEGALQLDSGGGATMFGLYIQVGGLPHIADMLGHFHPTRHQCGETDCLLVFCLDEPAVIGTVWRLFVGPMMPNISLRISGFVASAEWAAVTV